MLDGSIGGETITGFTPPRVEATRPPQNFTPFPEYTKPTMIEPPKYEKPTTMSPEDRALTDRLMQQIMDKPKPKKADEVIPHIEKNLPQKTKKSQGIWAQVLEWFRNIFK